MTSGSQYQFGPFRFDAKGRVLYRGSRDVGLPPKAADTLLTLIANAGEVVEKDTLHFQMRSCCPNRPLSPSRLKRSTP